MLGKSRGTLGELACTHSIGATDTQPPSETSSHWEWVGRYRYRWSLKGPKAVGGEECGCLPERRPHKKLQHRAEECKPRSVWQEHRGKRCSGCGTWPSLSPLLLPLETGIWMFPSLLQIWGDSRVMEYAEFGGARGKVLQSGGKVKDRMTYLWVP